MVVPEQVAWVSLRQAWGLTGRGPQGREGRPRGEGSGPSLDFCRGSPADWYQKRSRPRWPELPTFQMQLEILDFT